MLSFYAVVGPGAAAADAQPTAERHISGSFTNRGLNNYAAHVQHGLPLEDLLTMALGAQSERGQGKTALEIGCGEAHALLDLQQMYPAMATHCQNSAGYAAWCRGFDPTGVNPNRTKCGNGPTQQPPGGQNISTATWKATAASFNISTELPRWPHVTFAHFGGTRSLPFPSSQFHFIMSQHALDEGKIMRPREEFPQILREVIRLLRDDGGISLTQTVSGHVDNDDFVANVLSSSKHQEKIRTRMEQAKFPFNRGIVRASIQDDKKNITHTWKRYFPVDFRYDNPISNVTCVDLFSFVSHGSFEPGGGGLYLVARKHPCRLSDRKASCLRWDLSPPPQTRSIQGYAPHYVDIVHRLIEGGTKCMDRGAAARKPSR